MRWLVLLSIILTTSHLTYCLTGYQFEDNRSEKRYLQENGEMTVELTNMPYSLATCFSLYISYNRYSSLVPIMDFRTSYGADYLEFLYGRNLLTLLQQLNNKHVQENLTN